MTITIHSSGNVIKKTSKAGKMIYFAYITIVFFGIRFLVALMNVIFSPVLKKRRLTAVPRVSVLIPARNEEENIGVILSDLQQVSHKNMEVIVFNDQSTDNSAALVNSFIAKDSRLKLIHSERLPDGWLGKNYACHRLAQAASGEYYLFLDADVGIKPDVIESALAQMQKHELKLLSIFPKQIMKTTGEKITVPVMNSILLSLLPLIFTRTAKNPSLAAANGQFMLFDAESYHNIQPHEKMKLQKVEDILIARYFKQKRLNMQCMTGNDLITCRMYSDFQEAVYGFSKNVAEFFGGSHFAAFVYWLIGAFGIFSVIFSLQINWVVITLFMIIAMKILVSISSRQNILENLIFAIPQQIVLCYIIWLSFRNKKRKNYKWKGRTIG